MGAPRCLSEARAGSKRAQRDGDGKSRLSRQQSIHFGAEVTDRITSDFLVVERTKAFLKRTKAFLKRAKAFFAACANIASLDNTKRRMRACITLCCRCGHGRDDEGG